jgi:hypothetical protein
VAIRATDPGDIAAKVRSTKLLSWYDWVCEPPAADGVLNRFPARGTNEPSVAAWAGAAEAVAVAARRAATAARTRRCMVILEFRGDGQVRGGWSVTPSTEDATLPSTVFVVRALVGGAKVRLRDDRPGYVLTG